MDPNHLISFRQGNTLPHDFALSGPVKHIDFICPEGYAIRDTDEGEDAIGFITRYVDFTTGGKPVVWSEFGQSVWNNGRMAPDPAAIIKQGRYSEQLLPDRAGGRRRSAPCLGGGWAAIAWGERSDFGIVAPDCTERPAARLIREYGPRFKTPRGKPQPADVVRVRPRRPRWRILACGFQRGRGGLSRGREMRQGAGGAHGGYGQGLGDRPAGGGRQRAVQREQSAQTSGCGVQLLQVCDADGVWREAGRAEIAVAAGRPVRAKASMGNTQEATWLPATGTAAGGVALVARVSGKEAGRWPLTGSGVPYLGDATFDEFTLLASVGQAVEVTLRLEVVGRTPFGEARRSRSGQKEGNGEDHPYVRREARTRQNNFSRLWK